MRAEEPSEHVSKRRWSFGRIAGALLSLLISGTRRIWHVVNLAHNCMLSLSFRRVINLKIDMLICPLIFLPFLNPSMNRRCLLVLFIHR